jgi:amino acid transporter
VSNSGQNQPLPPAIEGRGNSLIRGLDLKQATALNMIDMVGIGPFVVMPLVIKTMNGPQCIAAWVLGAVLALLDGTVWSELGAKWPEAGGSFVFLRKLYGESRWGRLFSFLFIWQTSIQAPLVLASGAIGFSQYATYLVPLSPIAQKLVSGGLVLILVFALYRKITTIGKISLLLWTGVIGTILWVIVSGALNFNASLAFGYAPGAWDLTPVFFAALGQSTIKTVYAYLGYYNVCHLGGEIEQPQRNIPRSILLSILGIALLYLAMQLSVLGTLPWQTAKDSPFIYSIFIEHLYGTNAARIATLLILWIAFASLFSALLGYSRIPYAAAKEGSFFRPFARLHPTKHFPNVSLLVLGGVGFVFSLLFRLSDVITAILAMRILVQFISQSVGIILLRQRRKEAETFPYRMPLYPIPAILAIVVWAYLFYSTGLTFMLAGIGVLTLGAIVYLIKAKRESAWPFATAVAQPLTS